MSSYIIEGGKKLEGEVNVSGSKNASLPILASTILNKGTTKLYNVPEISDTKITQDILRFLGCSVKKTKGKIEINSKNMYKKEIPEKLMHQMRSTVVLAGAILGRFKEVRFSYPGGCDIGARPIDLHLKSFAKLGINITENAGFIICKCDKITGANIDLDFPSVGATENIILASVYADGVTNITNAAMEPEIVDLANCLNKMGAKIEGAGSNNIKITGVKNLKDISYNIMSDRIEAGTLLCMVASTGGKLRLKNINSEIISPVLTKLEETGCYIKIEKNQIYLEAPKRLRSTEIKTMPYPGFPTDMQPQMMVLLSMTPGVSVITETVFENRFMHVGELGRMGANIKIDGKVAIVEGVSQLTGCNVKATDLRAGAAMILAGLVANGQTEIGEVYHIDRGYTNIEEKFVKLGADIERVTI